MPWQLCLGSLTPAKTAYFLNFAAHVFLFIGMTRPRTHLQVNTSAPMIPAARERKPQSGDRSGCPIREACRATLAGAEQPKLASAFLDSQVAMLAAQVSMGFRRRRVVGSTHPGRWRSQP